MDIDAFRQLETQEKLDLVLRMPLSRFLILATAFVDGDFRVVHLFQTNRPTEAVRVYGRLLHAFRHNLRLPPDVPGEVRDALEDEGIPFEDVWSLELSSVTRYARRRIPSSATSRDQGNADGRAPLRSASKAS